MKSTFKFPQPAINPVGKVDFPPIKLFHLSNGMPVYLLEAGSLEITKIEIVFRGGRPFEHKRLAAITCMSQLREGFDGMHSPEIAERLDHRGATLSIPPSFDYIGVQLYALSKHIPELIPIINGVVQAPSFPEEELSIFKKRTAERLKVDLSQNDVIAYRKATEIFFGEMHPYGYSSTIEDYNAIERADLVAHHKNTFTPQNGMVFLAGRPTDAILNALDKSIGSWMPEKNETARSKEFPPLPSQIMQLEEDMGKSQSAIRIGRSLFSRGHEDYPTLYLLNTILGGYFGSRLMKNIREEKGLTYGIHSSLETLLFSGYFNISMETERRNVGPALKEIEKELIDLQKRLIPEDELEVVKNYLGGYILSLMDGPLQIINMVKSSVIEGHSTDYVANLLIQLQNTSPEALIEMARKYLNYHEMSRVIIH